MMYILKKIKCPILLLQLSCYYQSEGDIPIYPDLKQPNKLITIIRIHTETKIIKVVKSEFKMKLFNIFDEMGNKIGEMHETENPLDGAWCVLTVIISFILGMGIIFA